MMLIWAAMVAACAGEGVSDICNCGREVVVTITSDDEGHSAGVLTQHRDGEVVWSEGDKVLTTAYHSSGKWGRFYHSEEGTLTDDGAKASFRTAVELQAATDGNYTLFACYPDTAFNGGEATATTDGCVDVVIPTTQQMPSKGTFDRAGDLMVGISTKRYDTLNETMVIPFRYTRLVAHGSLTIKHLAAEEGEVIKSVTLSAPTKAMCGSGSVDITTATLSSLDSHSVTVVAPAGSAATESLDLWFCVAPTIIGEGERLKISVKSSRGVYEREIVARNAGINFYRNKYNTLSVDMSSATFTPFEKSETIISAECGFGNSEEVKSVSGDQIEVTFSQNSGSNPPRYYTNGSSIRCYGKNSFSVSSEFTIVKIELIFGTGDGSNTITSSPTGYSSGVWRGEANSVKFTVGGSSGHRRVERIIVTYRTTDDIPSEGDGSGDSGDSGSGDSGSGDSGDSGGGNTSTPSESWLELPAFTSSSTAVELKVSSSGERNYTAFYDKETYTSLWVAYPLEARHMGYLSRPDGWSYNPLLSTSYQVNLCNHSYSSSYSRGHLIPNASRNGILNMQLQTFYVTNSVPQIQDNFNGGIWQKLEAALQDKAERGIIYIVTGVAFQKVGETKSIKYTTAKDDTKRVPVPNYFYKVALKVKTNSSGTITSAATIGFWFDHKTYTDSYTNHTATVDQIEQWTGFDFFANLPDSIEMSVESNSNWTTFNNF